MSAHLSDNLSNKIQMALPNDYYFMTKILDKIALTLGPHTTNLSRGLWKHIGQIYAKSLLMKVWLINKVENIVCPTVFNSNK